MGSILELVASIAGVSASWMKKCLKLWLTNLMDMLIYANYIDVKMASQGFPKYESNYNKKRASSGETNGCLGKPDTHVNLTE